VVPTLSHGVSPTQHIVSLIQGSSILLLEVNYPVEFHSYCNQTSESPYQALRDSFPDGGVGAI